MYSNKESLDAKIRVQYEAIENVKEFGYL